MTPNAFIGLGVVAVITLAAAIATHSATNQFSAGQTAGNRVLPALSNNTAPIAKLELKQGSKTLTFERSNDIWRIAQKNGYPADADKIRALSVRLSTAELIEPKTSKPDLYSELDLEDPAKPGAKSTHVKFTASDNKKIAEIIIGKRRFGAFGASKNGTYIRKPGDPQTWLTNTDVASSVSLSDWVDANLFETARANIKRISITGPGTANYTIAAASPDNKDFKLIDIPESKKLKADFKPGEAASAFQSITFEDVRKASEKQSPGAAIQAVLSTADDVETTFRFSREASGYWVSVIAAGRDKGASIAEKLNKRAGGWEFKIPDSKAKEFLKAETDLFEKG